MGLSPLFLKHADGLLAREGGEKYTDRAADLGGPTRWGITLAKLTEWRGRPCTAEDVRNLGRDEAMAIYDADFFVKPGFDKVALLSEPIAAELLDTGVNLGTAYPRRWLQEVLNLCNRRGRDYPDLPVTGTIGPQTIAALTMLLRLRGAEGEAIVLRCLNGEQYARYKAITASGGPNGLQEENFCGWISKRIGFA